MADPIVDIPATIAKAVVSMAGQPMITIGTGAPSGPCTIGHLYLRTDGGLLSTLYVCEGPLGKWTGK